MNGLLASMNGTELFQQLDLGSPFEGWYLLVSETPAAVADELVDLFHAFDVSVERREGPPEDLAVPAIPGIATLALGVEGWEISQASDFDLLREQVRDARPLLLIVTNEAGAVLLARHAPNAMSFFAVTTVRWNG